MQSFETVTTSAEQTFDFGLQFSQRIKTASVICFYGDLGAGKTTCIKGICAGLGVSQLVTSPTFTLINEYNGRLPVFHFDFYRIASEQEAGDLGLDEYFFGDGVCLIEWPQVIERLLPENRCEIHLQWDFDSDEKMRKIRVLCSAEAPILNHD